MTVGLLFAHAFAATLAFAPPHVEFKASSPAHNSHLKSAPARLTLWFTAKPQLPFSQVRLVGPNGDIALGKLTADTGNALKADVVGAMPNGTYKVLWKSGGSDGHTMSGEFSFMIADATAPEHSTPLEATQSATSATAPPAGARVVRLFEFIGLLVVLGVLVFVHGVLPPLAMRGVQTADVSRQARVLGGIIAIVYVAAAYFRLVLQAQAVGAPTDAPMQALKEIVLRSSWGNGWLIGEVGALLVIAGFWLSIRKLRAGSPMALTGALAMILSPALSGHAAAARLFIPSVTLDALHVAAVGSWLGTLAVVMFVGVPAMARVKDGNPDAAVSALVNSFHPIALLAAPLAVLAGAGSSVLRLGSIGALTGTRYGSVLIIKLIGVAMVASVGAWNSMRARRRLGTPAGTLSLRRSAAVELALAAYVLWATTDLVATVVPTELTAP